MKKRCNRRRLIAVPPPGLRPKLPQDARTKVGLLHIETLDAIARGQADEAAMLDWCENVFTWCFVAELLGRGELEMKAQTELATRLIHRWARTGAVRFDGADYQLAKWGVAIMDQLAAETDTVTAARAGAMSVQCMRQLQAEVRDMRAPHPEGQQP